MATETIFSARYGGPASPAAGVTHASITPSCDSKIDQGAAGSPGDADVMVTNRHVAVALYGTDYAALLALVGVAAANQIFGTYGAAAALEKITVKNVTWTNVINPIDIPEKDSGGKLAPFGISGIAAFSAEDTFALMILGASDT